MPAFTGRFPGPDWGGRQFSRAIMAEDWKPGSNVLRILGVSIAYQKRGRNTQSGSLLVGGTAGSVPGAARGTSMGLGNRRTRCRQHALGWRGHALAMLKRT
jgi:hypothetical protein